MLTFNSFGIAVGQAVLVGCLFIAYLLGVVRRAPTNHRGARRVARAIKSGAMTFLKVEYQVIAAVVLPVAVLLGFVGSLTGALCFLSGSVLSLTCGFVGMHAATDANVRTAIAARNRGERAAFRVSFYGGGVMGFAVATAGVLGLGLLVYLFSDGRSFVFLMSCFGAGASLVAFFARVGGGIFTKSADIGADLVGKMEAGIPEDDPRNPAVIADNVGDCVGDTAGMGADIYESYVGSMISSVALAAATYPGLIEYLTLPVVLAICGLLGSMVGLLSGRVVRLSPAVTLRVSTYVAILAFGGLAVGYMSAVGIMANHSELFISLIVGCLAGLLVGMITEYYTNYRPVRRLAESARSGAATNIIYGLSVGMESTVIPVVVLAFTVWLSYAYGGGFYGVSIAAISMLSTVAMTMTVDG
jgi:K(+)-stimulated pyrophosphate-energized sodium pump